MEVSGISLQPTVRYIYSILESVEFIYHGQYSAKDSIIGGTLKVIIYNKNNQGGTPYMIHGRYTSMKQFYLNICD